MMHVSLRTHPGFGLISCMWPVKPNSLRKYLSSFACFESIGVEIKVDREALALIQGSTAMTIQSSLSACTGLPSAEQERGISWEVVICAISMVVIFLGHGYGRMRL